MLTTDQKTAWFQILGAAVQPSLETPPQARDEAWLLDVVTDMERAVIKLSYNREATPQEEIAMGKMLNNKRDKLITGNVDAREFRLKGGWERHNFY